ncbi:hypothetical protein, partial [Pontiella sp.]|uniref:hypothetical protein n=1 Tax=Pontiella sp. TaxID=2837462 RepID=UPI0035688F1F
MRQFPFWNPVALLRETPFPWNLSSAHRVMQRPRKNPHNRTDHQQKRPRWESAAFALKRYSCGELHRLAEGQATDPGGGTRIHHIDNAAV